MELSLVPARRNSPATTAEQKSALNSVQGVEDHGRRRLPTTGDSTDESHDHFASDRLKNGRRTRSPVSEVVRSTKLDISSGRYRQLPRSSLHHPLESSVYTRIQLPILCFYFSHRCVHIIHSAYLPIMDIHEIMRKLKNRRPSTRYRHLAVKALIRSLKNHGLSKRDISRKTSQIIKAYFDLEYTHSRPLSRHDH
jgi:hypothetical protein